MPVQHQRRRQITQLYFLVFFNDISNSMHFFNCRMKISEAKLMRRYREYVVTSPFLVIPPDKTHLSCQTFKIFSSVPKWIFSRISAVNSVRNLLNDDCLMFLIYCWVALLSRIISRELLVWCHLLLSLFFQLLDSKFLLEN